MERLDRPTSQRDTMAAELSCGTGREDRLRVLAGSSYRDTPCSEFMSTTACWIGNASQQSSLMMTNTYDCDVA